MSQDFRDLFAAFNATGVKYLVVGAHAYSHYHKPRFTKDLDVWVEPTPENARRVATALAAFGAPDSFCAPEQFDRPGGTLQIGVEPVRIDVLTEIAGVSFEDGWANKVPGRFMDEAIFFLGLEDLIKNKSSTGRPRDLLDAEDLRSHLPQGDAQTKQ